MYLSQMPARAIVPPDGGILSQIYDLNHRRQVPQDTLVSRRRRVGSVVERVTSNDKVQGLTP